MRLRGMRLLCCLIVGLISLEVRSQNGRIDGVVVDSASQLPIAFVGITVKETKKGVLTDIDGRFSLSKVPRNSHLVISYIGYVLKEIKTGSDTSLLTIEINRKNESLDEVVVSSNLNPAHRIILLMQEHKKQNDPLRLPAYFYNAYTIAGIGVGPRMLSMGYESAQRNAARLKSKPDPRVQNPQKKLSANDSIMRRAQRSAAFTLINNYMFVTESYSERKHLYPGRSKENVLATRVTGIKNPLFAVTIGAFESFGFYMDYLTLITKTYTSPVINGSINFYKFTLRQVIPHEKDTTWVISFEPRKNKNFNALTGVLYINSDNYAIENVTAAPSDAKGMILSFRLQQKYEKVNGQWFPKQMNSYVAQKDAVKDSVLLFWDTRTYITNVDLNRTFTRSEFSDITTELKPDAGKTTDKEWELLRTDSLPAKEKATYKAYDSMPPSFTRTLNAINRYSEIIALRAIPWGKVDIPFSSLISGINYYEKVRLGFGVQTNTLFSKWLSAGAYTGYGLGDHAWKYGGNLSFVFDTRTHTELRFSYKQDLQEPGIVPFFAENATLYSNNVLRGIYASRFDSTRQVRVQLNSKITPGLQGDVWLMQEKRDPASYNYVFDIDSKNQFHDSYNVTEIGLGLRYTTRETYVRFGRATVMNRPSKARVLFQVSKGVKDLFGGEVDYTKMALKINYFFNTRMLGRTSFQAELGKIWGNVPYGYMFDIRGTRPENRKATSLYIGNSFQTLGVYEFTATQSASLFLQQNFGSLLVRPKSLKFRPEFVLIQNIAYGRIDNPLSHAGLTLQAPEKGIFETGLMINNIYRTNLQFFYLGLSVGYFRRYGTYTLADASKNGAFKFGLTASF